MVKTFIRRRYQRLVSEMGRVCCGRELSLWGFGMAVRSVSQRGVGLAEARVLVSAVSSDGARAGWQSREAMMEVLMPKGPTIVSRSVVAVVRTSTVVRGAESAVRAAWESAW